MKGLVEKEVWQNQALTDGARNDMFYRCPATTVHYSDKKTIVIGSHSAIQSHSIFFFHFNNHVPRNGKEPEKYEELEVAEANNRRSRWSAHSSKF